MVLIFHSAYSTNYIFLSVYNSFSSYRCIGHSYPVSISKSTVALLGQRSTNNLKWERKKIMWHECKGTNTKVQGCLLPLRAYGVETCMFEGYDHRESRFERYCKNINGLFTKWIAHDKKQEYLQLFPQDNWKKLAPRHTKRHSIVNCIECALSYELRQQESFTGTVFKPTRCITQQVKEIMEKNATTKLMLSHEKPLGRS